MEMKMVIEYGNKVCTRGELNLNKVLLYNIN